MLSQTAQYALRAVIVLATKKVPMTVQQLALETKVPDKYLAKVMQTLVRADIASSKPGKAGGFTLKIPTESLTLLTIIDAFDAKSDDELHMGLQSYGNPLRPLNQKLKELNALVRAECGKTTIKQLI